MKIAGPIKLFRQGVGIYFSKSNIGYFLKLGLVNVLFVLLATVPLIIFNIVYGNVFAQTNPPERIVTFAVYVPSIGVGIYILISVVSSWMNILNINAAKSVVAGSKLPIGEGIKKSWKKLWNYILTATLVNLVSLGGLILLVIPGFIFYIWFFFSRILISTEEVGVKESLKISKNMVSGRFLPVAGRILALIVIFIPFYLAFSYLPYIGRTLLVFTSPLITLVFYLLFNALNTPTTNAESQQPQV